MYAVAGRFIELLLNTVTGYNDKGKENIQGKRIVLCEELTNLNAEVIKVEECLEEKLD